MADYTAIREALAANLTAVTGLQETPYMLSRPTPPVAEVVPGPIEYDQTYGRGEDELRFTVRVMVGKVTDRGSQKRLDRMLAPTGTDSIKTAVESNPTLGGLIDDLHVTGASGYRQFRREGGSPLLGAEWTVRVLARP